jgi:hypothetical protein
MNLAYFFKKIEGRRCAITLKFRNVEMMLASSRIRITPAKELMWDDNLIYIEWKTTKIRRIEADMFEIKSKEMEMIISITDD